MATSINLSNLEALELYRVALENTENQSEIAKVMSEFGYGKQALSEGKALLLETRHAFDGKKAGADDKHQAYADFAEKKQELTDLFTLHRKKAKVVFRNDVLTAEKLSIRGTLSGAYVKWLEKIKIFYSESLASEEIQKKLLRLKVTKAELEQGKKLTEKVEAARATYLIEKGESEDATKIKDLAFEKMDDWMSEFYAVAKIALEDHPQLMEALGKKVR